MSLGLSQNQIPIGVARRLSSLSSSEEIFNKVAPQYEDYLKKSGYSTKLTYMPEVHNQHPRHKCRPARNRNNVKLSWSTGKNMASILAGQNKRKLSTPETGDTHKNANVRKIPVP